MTVNKALRDEIAMRYYKDTSSIHLLIGGAIQEYVRKSDEQNAAKAAEQVAKAVAAERARCVKILQDTANNRGAEAIEREPATPPTTPQL